MRVLKPHNCIPVPPVVRRTMLAPPGGGTTCDILGEEHLRNLVRVGEQGVVRWTIVVRLSTREGSNRFLGGMNLRIRQTSANVIKRKRRSIRK